MIKNLILDFGDVFINLDKEATARMLIRHGFAGITPGLLDLFENYETGRISTDEFLFRARKWVPEASDEQLVNAWNAIILDFPDYRLEFLQGLARENRFRLFLLSNTNSLHLERVVQRMGKDRYDQFIKCFDCCYFSHEIGLRKPDKAIFNHVLEDQTLIPEETFFVDDTREHIESSRELGIKTWHLKVGADDIVQLKSRLPDD